MNRSLRRMSGMLLAMLCAGSVNAPAEASLPEPVQRLQFTAEEGTWLSLDVSPDGRTLVFDLLGDLYELPIVGGEAKRLTHGSAFDAQPRYSPDGRSIAFISDRSGADNVWIMDADGARPRAITDEREQIFISPEWTPDGRSIVVSRSTGTNVNIYGRDVDLMSYPASGGSVGMPLTGDNDDRRSMLGAAFGGDPDHLFASRGVLREYGSWQVVRLDRKTGRVDPWTRRLGGGLRPTLSPDGRWLVYVTRVADRTTLTAMELASGAERTLVPEFERDEQEGWAPMRDLASGASFTPDSRALIVSFGGKLHRIDVASGAITPIPFRASVDIGVTPRQQHEYSIADDAVTARRIEQPSYLTDGKAVAFSSLGRIWVQRGQTSSPRQLSPEGANAFHPTWSPDGRYVAYVTWDDLEGGALWRMRADGKGRAQRLTRVPGFYEGIAYSRDGRRIVAIRSPQQLRMGLLSEPEPQLRGELVWFPAAGGDATVITAVRDAPVGQLRSLRAGTPHFTNDPERVFFKDPVEGLISVRWDGSDRRVELRVTGWDGLKLVRMLADELLISPDGQRALALINNQAWRVDLNGSREIALPEQGSSMTRLTSVGADFIGWGHDSAVAHWALGSALFTGTESARQDVTVRMNRSVAAESVVLSGARVITMRGDEVIENADVVVTGNRIAAVGPRGGVTLPSKARVIDVTGKTLLPGFVDIHSHNWPAWGVHRRQVWQYLAHLAYGVTSIRDPQTETLDVLTYGDRVSLRDILGPRVFSTGRGVYTAEDIRSPADARNVAQRYGQFFRTQTLKSYRVGDRQIRLWLLGAANAEHLTVTAEGNGDFKMNLTLAMDGFAGMEHSFAPTFVYDDAIRLFAASGITYTPTILEGVPRLEGEHLFYREHDVYNDAKLRRFLPEAELARKALRPWMTLAHPNQFATTPVAEQAGKILAAGGRIGLGSHGALAGLGTHWELWLLGKGMSAHDALRVATIMSAEAIGHGRNFGSIEVGKLADLQILDANPLEDLRHSTSIRYVMSDGRLFEAATLNQLWPQARPLEPQWWWSTEPRGADLSRICP